MNLYECLNEYKNITLELINKVSNDQELQKLLEMRAEIIDQIGKSNFSKVEFKELVSSLNILELDKELQDLVKQEKVKTRNQIDNIRKIRIARRNYNNSRENIRLFSGKG
ncbi:flagellar protein FliT [Clostridium beijerinckii]|uniref:Flagellar protein FliT n=1 Tax=Clostridium beijerinckii TaxID=1520 RepID=A0AAW3W7G2_CLOBE|nr:flagellar protein FliT [Clostridium beijerinckii]MBC2455907.1 flagellar protein FliT [Clostridium beijerinckii]MBC2474712.1 flagellar protein FliT [Clostridium beijerinckii]MDG5852870.1 flagellar protein FliT [Clostridium beijerinckii]NOV61862.1 hypothetical protein [Clostridium beijerinckii]NOV68642.1 hypothetical protein [Clostridium beijerinckii]